MTQGVETFGPTELRTFVESRGGKRRTGYAGSGHQTFVMPDGSLVPVPGHGTVVTILVGRRVAEALGMTRAELYEAMGRPMAKTGKIRRGVSKTDLAGPTRREVVEALDHTQGQAQKIRETLKGQRDPAHYRRLLEAIAPARRALDDAARHAGVAS